GACMQALESSGIAPLAVEAAASGRPFIGICVGMQLLYELSDESPGVDGLGILPGTVRLLPGDVKRPQMQWNRLVVTRPDPLLTGWPEETWVYFVHSHAAEMSDDVIATCDYGGPVVAAEHRGNV